MVQLDVDAATGTVHRLWDDIEPVIEEYIRIPARSPLFDRDWSEHGHIEAAVGLVRDWCAAHAPEGAVVDVQRLAGRTPLIVIEIDAAGGPSDETVLLYGHLDKQPEMTGWREGLGPWEPVREGDRLYGRGGADDGYSAFAVIAALTAVREAGGRHARCVALIEASEESGSVDLPAHLDALGDRLGAVGLVVCLDSGAADYDALWLTTSLRGVVNVELEVDVLTQGQHSGLMSGAVPSSFRIVRTLLDRIEDARTGRILLPELHVDIPPGRAAEAAAAASVGYDPRTTIPWAGSTTAMTDDVADLLLATTWRPTVSYVGMDGIPSRAEAGMVLRPSTALTLSFRVPPTCDPDRAAAAVVAALEAEPPYGATVTATAGAAAPGWDAPVTAPWLEAALAEASSRHFGRPAGAFGLGGSIPFMAMLGARYPDAQFVVTGVLGPESNAHGPDEFLHLPTARRVTACVAEVLDAHAAR